MKKILGKIINIGVTSKVNYYEIQVIRKINIITLVSFINMIFGVIFFAFINEKSLFLTCLCSLFLLPLVYLINKFSSFYISIYLYYCISFLFFIFLNLFWGVDSFIFLWYFPLIISMVQLLSKKETLKHLFILSSITLMVIIFTGITYKFHFYASELTKELSKLLFEFNLICSFTTTMIIIAIISFENNYQENRIKKMLTEKEILLAEVFHRVKNNLNIVTSLLNLKKNISVNNEVKMALEECKNRIFSMALVHNNLISSNEHVSLNFKEYVKKLIAEIASSLGVDDNIDVILNAEEINLELSNSIPCGLILNELITNSYKYAKVNSNCKLVIIVNLHSTDNKIELNYKDNGTGIPENILNQKEIENSLGIELIKSLSDQLNGEFFFENNNGMNFNLVFIA